MHEEAIEVRPVNNLKNIPFSIPINQLTVVTGVSGSGKSSLAFDTITRKASAATSNRCGLRAQFLSGWTSLTWTKCAALPGHRHSPKNSTRNPRSTVGTQTEIFDYLRLLYARVARPIAAFAIAKSTKTRRNLWPTKFWANFPRARVSMSCFPPRPGWRSGRTATRGHETANTGTRGHGGTEQDSPSASRLRVSRVS